MAKNELDTNIEKHLDKQTEGLQSEDADKQQTSGEVAEVSQDQPQNEVQTQ